LENKEPENPVVYLSNLIKKLDVKNRNGLVALAIVNLLVIILFKFYLKGSGLFMIGGGVPKNFIQDTVICAELLGKEVDMHKYAIQITVADSRDGACSSSTLKEASSWGKVDITKEQMVFAEATSVLPLIASDAYHKGEWKKRERKNFSKIFS